MADKAEVLSQVELPPSKNSVEQAEGTPEPILGGAAVSRGRIFFVSSDAVYAIGPKTAKAATGFAVDAAAERGEGAPSYVRVAPTELVLKPGQAVTLHARLFDGKGRFLREATGATWTVTRPKGTDSHGVFTAAGDPVESAGTIKATVGALSGEARAK